MNGFKKIFRRAGIVLAVAALTVGSAQGQLLHRYDFQTAGNANDIVGTANGTIYGTATVSGGALNTTGVIGALSGGVPQNSVGLPPSAVAGITNAFSIEIWFYANYNGPTCTLFSFSDSTTSSYVLATPATGSSPFPSRVEVIGGGGKISAQDADQIYCDNATLHDMVVSYDGTNVTYYLDGTLAAYSGLANSFSDPGLNLSRLTYIGIAGGSPAADNTINGQVYDFRIYGQALNLAQMAAIYKLGSGASASNAAISNALASPIPSAEVSNSGNLVRMPFYGSPFLHDPGTMRKDGSSYFIFGDGNGIAGITSTDLRNWSPTTPVFPNGPPSWTTNAVPGGTPNYFWAPDLAFFNGLWHIYYAYSQFGTIESAIGMATSPSLASPNWTDHGKIVQSNDPATTNTDTTAYNCIDPSIYVAANGTVWMSFGSYSSGILVTQIDPTTGRRLNTNSLVTTLVANNAPGGGWGSSEEGSCIYQHGGYWYLFANWGGCCDGVSSTYNIRVGRGTSPTGPYYDRNGVNLNNSGGTMFLESTARYIGPGHAAIMQDTTGTNWFTYHFYDGLANGNATVGMNQLYWSADGWPVMTNDWSVLYPLASDANESSGTYDGTLENAAGFTNDPVRGNVLNLNGTSGYLSLPLSVGNCSTVSAWVKWNGGAAWQRIFDFGSNTTNYFFLTPLSGSGNLRCAITVNGPGGEQQLNAPFAFPTNSWHHVAVTLDGTRSTGILYLDGGPVVTNSSLTIRPWQTLPQNNTIGKSQFSADPLFKGEISSFRIFGRALSAAEVNNIYAANPFLAHRYSFATNGPPAWDSIGMAHGTLVGNAIDTNNALDLNGAAGGYVNLPPGLVSGSSAVTLEFWATFGANNSWAYVFGTGNIVDNAAQDYFDFSPHNGSSGQQLDVSTTGATRLIIPGTLDSSTVHVAAICDPANKYMAVFTNGVLEAALTNTVPAFTGISSAWSFIGRPLTSGYPYLNATIDELRLYDGRLTPQQIAADDLAGPNILAAPPIAINSTNIVFTVSGNTLTLSWPADHLGWQLQMQTNNLAAGLSTNWFVVPDSTTTNSMTVPVNLINGCTFYRLSYP
jgi:Glycosyl hydrolases family 43/Concanavalin A-like lectin/glucanases superfamily